MIGNDSILTVSGLNVAYGEAKVLFDVGIAVRPCEVVACVGRNGAGKTTLLKTIAGFIRPTSGGITFNATSLIGMTPFAIAGGGLKYVPQDKRVFSDLTVRENLELASYATHDYDWSEVTQYFPKLTRLMDRKAGFLSGGERQMLMIGQSMLGHPKVLLIDEPTEGLAPSIVAHLKDVFSALRKKTALVLIEQNLPLVCAIADRIYALCEGRIMAELTGRESVRPEVCEPFL